MTATNGEIVVTLWGKELLLETEKGLILQSIAQ